LRRGAKVRLLDAGVTLEPTTAEVIARMRQTSPSSWTPDQIAQLKKGTDANAKGIPLKRAYGSDFPYREGEQHLRVSYDDIALRPSLAKGGLSNVWGAAMLPYAERDLAGWPISLSDLAEHYAAVAHLIGPSARPDDLDALFPLHHTPPGALELSRQATLLLHRLERNRERLAQAGVHFGQARVAVRVPLPSQPGATRSRGAGSRRAPGDDPVVAARQSGARRRGRTQRGGAAPRARRAGPANHLRASPRERDGRSAPTACGRFSG
jgi:hypothetical protein